MGTRNDDKAFYLALFFFTLFSFTANLLAQEVCLPVEQRGVYIEVPYVVKWNIKSDCSTKAKNDLNKLKRDLDVELTRCNAPVEPPVPTPTPTPIPPPPPVSTAMQQAIELWQANLIDRINWHYANPYTTGSSQYNDEHYNIIYYEGAKVFKNAQTYLTSHNQVVAADKAKSISDRLVAGYPTAWNQYRTGSQWAFADTASMISDALLLNTAENNAYWYDEGLQNASDNCPINNPTDCNDMRGIAYYLASLAKLQAKSIPVTRGHTLTEITTLIADYTNNYPHAFDLFYMNAMLGNVLLDNETVLAPFINARLTAQRIANFIKPFVQANGQIVYGTGNHPEKSETYADLNLLIAPLFFKLGDRVTAEKLFIFGVNNNDLIYYAKAVPQNYLYSFDLVNGW